jgi:hypothetical protein
VLLAYAKFFSQTIGHNLTRTTIRVSAIPGSAAMKIRGQTTGTDFGCMKEKHYATQENIDAHIYWEKALNCVVELKGTHRFSKCPQMKCIMLEMRERVSHLS